MNRICRDCGSMGKPKSDTPGSILIEIVLWICFIVPGLIYSLWRLSRRRKVCAVCGSANIVPVDSPVGQDLVRRLKQPEIM